MGSHQGASGVTLRGRIGFQTTLWASNLCSTIFRNFVNFFLNSFKILVRLLLFCISYRKQSKYGMPKRCNYVKEKEGGKWWLEIPMLESLGRASLSSNSGWTETCLARAHLYGASTGRQRVKQAVDQHFSGEFNSLLWVFFFFFGWISFLGSKFCFYFGINVLLLRDFRESLLNLGVLFKMFLLSLVERKH